MVQKAITGRPDLKAALQNLDIDDLSIAQSRNALLPNLALIGNYQTNGRGGVLLLRGSGAGQGLVQTIPGGLFDSLTQMFGFGFSSYQFGL